MHWFILNHRADGTEMEAVALDELVEFPSRGIIFVSTNTGIVGRRCSNKLLLFSSITTSDIVGLVEAEAWVHNKAISMIFFTSSTSYSLGSIALSTRSKYMRLSCSFHACYQNQCLIFIITCSNVMKNCWITCLLVEEGIHHPHHSSHQYSFGHSLFLGLQYHSCRYQPSLIIGHALHTQVLCIPWQGQSIKYKNTVKK